MKLVKMWEDKIDESPYKSALPFSVLWMQEKINESRKEIDKLFQQFQLSEVLKTIYSLIWNDFCSWYLEWIKPAKEEKINKAVYDATILIFNDLLQLLHPFMPFITEELYHLLSIQENDLMTTQLPQIKEENKDILKSGILLQNLISSIRDARNKNQLKPKDTIQLFIDSSNKSFYGQTAEIINKQVNAETLSFTENTIANCISLVVDTEKIYIQSNVTVDVSVQKEKMEQELNHLKGFLTSVEKKLGNERFMQNAKEEVIAIERKKQEDTLAKIKSIEESLGNIAIF